MKAKIILSLLALTILCVGCGEPLDSSNGDELDTSTGEEHDTSTGEEHDTSTGEEHDTSTEEEHDTSTEEEHDTSTGEELDTSYWEAENILFPPPTGPVEIEQAAKVAAQSICSRMERCRNRELDGSLYENEPCIQYFTRAIEDSYDLPKASSAGRILWDEQKMGQCLEDYALTDCRMYVSMNVLPCISTVGNTQPGQPCVTSDECVNDHWCDESQSCPGICVAPRGIYEFCNYSNDQCASGLTCEDDGCLPILEQGEECNEAYTNCAEGLFCEIYEGYDHTGSCEPESWIYEELEPGQSCSNSLSTYDLCKGEHFCIPVDLIDDRWVELQCRMPQSSGASCVRDYRSPRDPCSADEYCKAEGDGLREWGTCTPRRSIGESCDQDNSCIKGVSCDRLSHTCVVPGLNRPGEICEENSDCYSRQCDWETKTCEYLVDC